MTPKEEIEQLRRELEQHNYNYYVLNQPTISDFDFDQMMHKLRTWRCSILSMQTRTHPRKGWGAT